MLVFKYQYMYIKLYRIGLLNVDFFSTYNTPNFYFWELILCC